MLGLTTNQSPGPPPSRPASGWAFAVRLLALPLGMVAIVVVGLGIRRASSPRPGAQARITVCGSTLSTTGGAAYAPTLITAAHPVAVTRPGKDAYVRFARNCRHGVALQLPRTVTPVVVVRGSDGGVVAVDLRLHAPQVRVTVSPTGGPAFTATIGRG
jgi:hypothetical protein